MANKKMWVRNYYNLFSALFGIGESSSATYNTPTESVPLVRFPDGNGQYVSLSINDTFKTHYSAALTLTAPSAYMTSAISTVEIADYVNGVPSFARLRSAPWGICLGSGTNDPTYEDYEIGSPIRSSMTVGSVTKLNPSYDSVAHSYTYGYKIPIAYSGSETITINEFGLYAPVTTSASGEYHSATRLLVYHEVFEQGITLQQNDTIEISITQTVTQPNYTPYPSE